VISVSAAAEQADLGPELADWTRAQAQAQRTVVVVVDDGTPLAGFALSDDIKTDAIARVERLRALGLRTVLLTGDSSAPAGVIAARIGTDEVIAEALPGDKAAVATCLKEAGHRDAMVGDSINDAPTLAAGDRGIPVVSGSDIAMMPADIIIVRDDLGAIAESIMLSRKTLGTIRGNLVWAFGYNALAIPIAMFGLLNPLISAAAMAMSSV